MRENGGGMEVREEKDKRLMRDNLLCSYLSLSLFER